MLSAMKVFWPDNIITEVACEQNNNCQTDQIPMKGLTAQWLGQTAQVAPFTQDSLSPVLRASATGAAKQCSGGNNTATCGFSWTSDKSDDNTGVGQQLDAMNVFLANLALNGVSTVQSNTTQTNATGTSQGSPRPPSTTSTQSNPTYTGEASQRLRSISLTALISIISLSVLYL